MHTKYQSLLKEIYPTKKELVDELINLNSKLYLPKGTEYFFSDLHGEAQAFIHLLRSASGNIREKTDLVFGNTLTKEDKDDLANLVYEPEKNLAIKKERGLLNEEWYTITIHRLVALFRYVSTKYPKNKVKEKFPSSYSEIIDELLYTNNAEFNKKLYYEKIIENIIKYDSCDDFIISLSYLIQRVSVDDLHIVGDIYDRGPAAHLIIQELIDFPSVDIQWGNHDIGWMGAACGNKALVASSMCNAIQYNNFDFLEDGYGINLRPLYEFAMTTYRNDPCHAFMPRIYEENHYDKINKKVAAKMFKAMSIIRFKLDGQLIERNPEFEMDSRNFLRFVDFEKMTYKNAKLLDTNFPTIDPKDPLKLTEGEEFVISVLQREFLQNPLLDDHIKFLYSHGSMYKVINGSLLFHGCIPLKEDGSFDELKIKGKSYQGKALMDIFETYIRKAYKEKNIPGPSFAKDLIWYLFYGKKSPLFGKSQYSYFENLLVEDEELKKEVMNPYFSLSRKEEVCDMILKDFGLEGDKIRIINGHVPVKVKKGDKPVRAKGKLYVIDGGISKPYQKKTGIAGYSLMFNSHHLALAEHKNFPTIRNNMGSYTPKLIETERMHPRMLIKDTDQGKKTMEKIEILEELLENYD